MVLGDQYKLVPVLFPLLEDLTLTPSIVLFVSLPVLLKNLCQLESDGIRL